MNYKFTLERIDISNARVHPSVIALGYNYKPFNDEEDNHAILQDFNYFEKFYDRPVAVKIGEQYLLLTHTRDFHLLKESGETEMEVYVGCFSDDLDIQRFIGLRNGVLKRNWRAQYEMATFFREYLETEEGKKYAKSIPHKKTREKIAYLMGTSDSTIQRVLNIGDNGPEYLDMITNEHISYNAADVAIKKDKYSGKKKDNEVKPKCDTNEEDRDKDDEDEKVTDSEPIIEDIIKLFVEKFSLEMIDGAPVVKFNSKEYQSIALRSSLEIINGRGRIELRDPRTGGAEFVISMKNISTENTVSFQNKKSITKTKKAA